MALRSNFETHLASLKRNMDEMGEAVENAFDVLIQAIAENNRDVLREIQDNDRKINEMERKIEAECLSVITRQQPVLAGDLRMVSSVMKAVSDMERIGDHAADIAEAALRLNDISYREYAESLPYMFQETQKILCDAAKLFRAGNEADAKEFYKRDDVIDEAFQLVKNELIDCLKEGKRDVDVCVELLMIAKYLERIGDHAVNLSEWEVFKETGNLQNYRIL